MNLNGMLIGSEDPKGLTDYYTKIFGKPSWEDDNFNAWQIGSGYITVGLHDGVKGKSVHPGRVMWNIETPDVKDEFEKLKTAGATVVQEPYKPDESSDMWIATFSDPDNNYFQLVSPM